MTEDAPNEAITDHSSGRNVVSGRGHLLSAASVTGIPHLGSLLWAQGLPLVAQGFLSLFTAAVLGPAGKGDAALAVTVASLGGAGLFMSMHVGLVGSYRRGGHRAIVRVLTLTAAVSLLPLLVGLATGVARLGPNASVRQVALFIGFAVIVLEAPFLVILRTAQGLGDAAAYRGAIFIRVAVYTAAVLLLAMSHLTAVKVVEAYASGDLAGIVYASLALRRIVTGKRPEILARGVNQWRPRLLRDLTMPSLQAHFATLSQQASYRTDIVLLGFLAPAAVLGQYAFATSIAEVLWIVSEAISLSVFSTVARCTSEGDQTGARRIFRRAVIVQLSVGVVGWAVVAVGSVLLLHVAFRAYQPALPLILILLPGVAVGGLARIISSAAIAAGRTVMVRACAVISLILVPIYIPLIIVDAAVGAAVASSIIYILSVALFAIADRRYR